MGKDYFWFLTVPADRYLCGYCHKNQNGFFFTREGSHGQGTCRGNQFQFFLLAVVPADRQIVVETKFSLFVTVASSRPADGNCRG